MMPQAVVTFPTTENPILMILLFHHVFGQNWLFQKQTQTYGERSLWGRMDFQKTYPQSSTRAPYGGKDDQIK